MSAEQAMKRANASDSAEYIGNWYFTGWGLLVREAGTLTRETPS